MLPSQLPNIPIVAVDTETSGLFPDDGARVSIVSVAYDDPFRDGEIESWAWPYDQGRRDKLDQAELFAGDDQLNLPRSEWDALLEWLAGRKLIYQNAKFDQSMLRVGTRHWAGRELEQQLYWDTMIASHQMWPTHPTSLKPTAERLGLLGKDGGERDKETDVKTWLRRARVGQGRYDLVPWEVIGPYAAMDAELTLRLYHHQQAELAARDDGPQLRRQIASELELSQVLYRMERRGIGFDSERCRQAAKLLRERQAELERMLPFDPGINQAKAWFFGKGGGGPELLPYAVTEHGATRLDEEIARKMVNDGVQWAAEYLEWRKIDATLSMHYDTYPDRVGSDGRLRTSYRQTKVVSGRMSVERVQLQAIPKDDKRAEVDGVPSVRSLFRPADGKQLYNLDYQQAELRVAAKFAGCRKMLAMLEQGADLHGITCETVIGTPRESPNWKRDRDVAKRANFSCIFGVGPVTFQATIRKFTGVELPLHESQQIVWGWRTEYPEFMAAYRRAEAVARAKGSIKLVDGSRSYFAAHEYTNTAWSRMVQGSLAVLLKRWLVEVERELPGVLLLTVHDSAVLEVGDERVPVRAQQIGERLARELFDVEIPVEIGPFGG